MVWARGRHMGLGEKTAHQWVKPRTTKLQCQGAINCCGTDGHWYYPDGTRVRNSTAGGKTLYMTRGGDNQDSLYLHRHTTAQAVASSGGRGVGLYRCQIPPRQTNGVIQIIYVGVYRANIEQGNIHKSCFSLHTHVCMCFQVSSRKSR